ncbi:uncharacterized protein LOC131657674 [Vicia villosa]|uniref:uncharacterized protein LOC131657674 n=1 Tax=Vicia villosa TaxID=3911 RepID=UPI00273AA270|nr:uncharacterized protein LOC131657674 [Vicia villosa]
MAKIKWLQTGDANTAFFHASIKARQNSKALTMLTKDDGTILTSQSAIEEVLAFYGNLMGKKETHLDHIDIAAMRRGSQLNRNQRDCLLEPVSTEEVYRALKGIDDQSTPGLDGYNSKFFKSTWDIIKYDLLNAIQEFFDKGKLYKAFNCTLVTLVPKSQSAKSVKDFRPISVCTTFYKIISRILTSRLSPVIASLVSPNQAAFIPGQQIHNNLLLAYELIKGYSRSRGPPRCMIQVDMQKAYDMIDWNALETIMQEMGIPCKFINWILVTLTTVSYRFNINGNLSQLLLAKRGIRGDVSSVDLLLKEFHSFPGSTGMKILNLSMFKEGSLPFRYLGMPLTSKKLSVTHYMVLIDKIVARISHWSSKLLTYAGRLVLIKSISFSMTNYWMLCFPLPKSVIRKIDSICRSFLWTGKDVVSRKSLVAWAENDCTMLKLLWNLCNKADSLWVKWINSYYLKRHTIMELKSKPTHSWIRRAILNQRDCIHKYQTIWEDMNTRQRFKCNEFYKVFQDSPPVSWSQLLLFNPASPRAVFIFWLVCHRKIPTKSRLCRFGLINDNKCGFCDKEETASHLFFECDEIRSIWNSVLHWLNIHHSPKRWEEEIVWIQRQGKGKGWRAKLFRLAITETIYGAWVYRNGNCFGKAMHRDKVLEHIMDKIVFRSWGCKDLKGNIVNYMAF